MSKIFISYRREETAPYAGRLYDRFVQEFGQDRVFIDVSTIEPGVDFVEAIEEAVAAVDVLVCVMGPEWSAITNNSGHRRLDDPADFVRLEVLSALKRDIRVVPVLVGGANMPSAEELPSDLKMLARRNALQLDDARFHSDIDRLIESIRNLLPIGDSGVELSSEVKPGKARKAGRWLIAGFTAMLLIAVGGWYAMEAMEEAGQQGAYRRMDFGFNGCDVQFGELKKGVSEDDMVRFAAAAGAKGFTYHPSLKFGKIMIGEYPQGCKSPANMSWPLFLKTELEAQRKASEIWTIPDTKSSFVEKNGHLVSVTNENPLCPTPPGWRTGCYAISPEHRQNWHNTPDGYVANGKKEDGNSGNRVRPALLY